MNPLAMIRRRIYSQRMGGRRYGPPHDAVRGMVAMQGQEFAEARWSVAQRCAGASDIDVRSAFDEGLILRTHLLRPTWHLVAGQDIRTILALTAPRVHQANAYMYRQLGLDPGTLARGATTIHDALADGALTRPRIADRLMAEGLDTEGIRLGYFLMNAELEGVICSGPLRGKQHTYMRLDDRVPPGPGLDHDQALADFTLRYFLTRGPATVRDLSYWSGLTLRTARSGLDMVRSDLTTITDEDGVEWFEDPALDPSGPILDAYLIPTYDETVMSYSSLKVVMSDASTSNDLLRRPVVVDGVTVGSWRRALSRESVTVDIRTFQTLNRMQRAAIEEAVDRYGRFLDLAPIARFDEAT